MPKKLRVGRIIREDVTIEMLPGETEDDAQQRCIATQADLKWDAYDCEYWNESADPDAAVSNETGFPASHGLTPAQRAAPDMLAALKRCVDQLSEKRPRRTGTRKTALDFGLELAIAEAGKAIAAAAEGR